MNSRWKAISIAALSILLLAAFHLHQSVTLQNDHLEKTIRLEEKLLTALAENGIKQMAATYNRRAESFVRVRGDLITLFAERNREELYQRGLPYFDTLKKENPAFAVMHFFLPDNTTFLCMGRPDVNGQDLAELRPIVAAVNDSHRQQTGFAVGRQGLFYRVVQPVFVNDAYIGGVEFGIGLAPLLHSLRTSTGNEVALLLDRAHFQKIELTPDPQARPVAASMLLPSGSALFSAIPLDTLAALPGPWRISQAGRSFHVAASLPLYDFQGKAIGSLVFGLDITAAREKLRRTVAGVALTAATLLAVVLFTLYFTFGALLRKILGLNESLRQTNENLEATVQQRTAELEEQISERQEAITSLKQEIAARRQAEQRLADEKELLAVTLASIGDAVIATDCTGRVFLINRSAEMLTGWEKEEATGMPLGEILALIDEKTGARQADPAAEIIRTAKSLTISGTILLLDRSGGSKAISASGAPILDRHGSIVGAILVCRDITARKRLEEEVLKVQKLESVGILAGGIAHDFNNILTAILGSINMAVKLLDPTHPAHDVLHSAEKASLRARDLTRQLLTFAKGGAPIKQTASIRELIRDSAGFILSGSKVSCEYHFAPDLRAVDIDPGQMSQVIQNLVLNACQAMDNAGRLAISATNFTLEQENDHGLPPGAYLAISIRDSGTGIDAAHLGRIFDPYFTTKEKSIQKGSGLGLAIVHSIVSHHGGQVRVDSTPGQGSTFTVFLPANDSVFEEKPTPDTPLTEGKGRILVMDDEEIVREVATMMLSHLGYDAVGAQNGAEMLAMYRSARLEGRPFAAVILDLTIPGGMGGEEAAAKLREIDPAARAVVSSGYSHDPIMAGFRNYGFMGALGKPFKVEELSRVLHQVLNQEMDT
ncbi:MAG: cache domain-containing protein [Thermodesulfobacteriota bacterium]